MKISDFGLSVFCQKLQQGPNLMHTTCGTLNYIAPEIVKNTGYDGTLADIWACGVILFFMLTGKRPFDDESVHKLLDKIIIGDFKFPSEQGSGGVGGTGSGVSGEKLVSEDAKDLIRCILNPNPRKRFTIEQIKSHKWFQEGGYEEDDLLSQFYGNWSASDIHPPGMMGMIGGNINPMIGDDMSS